jgi:hypothetical protein
VSRRSSVTSVVVGSLLAIAWAMAFPPWPDDWDGLGFLASISRFDLASFAPHPPGYPVYVALLKLAACVTMTPIGAARLVGVGSGAVTFGALCFALPREEDAPSIPERALVAAAICMTPLAFRAFSGVGSEAPALACSALALLGVAPRVVPRGSRAPAWLVGLGVGLGLGVRLSWGPFYAAFLLLVPRGLRGMAVLVASATCAAWALPLVVVTGPSQLAHLYRVHLGGHLARWGGTAITEPSRARFLFRDIFIDGLGGGTDALGLAILGVLAAVLVAALAWSYAHRTEKSVRAVTLSLLVLGAPYLAWVAIGQNLRLQPRHALPLVFVVSAGFAWLWFRADRTHAPRLLLGLLATLMIVRTSLDARARKTNPPPGIQLLEYLRAHADVASTVVFAGASGRFLHGTEWESKSYAAGSVGDALLALTHLDALPTTTYVTSELAGREDEPLLRVAAFCRPERLDRRGCLELFELDVRAAR